MTFPKLNPNDAASYFVISIVLLLILPFQVNAQPSTSGNDITYTKESKFIKEFQVNDLQERGLGGITTDAQGMPWFYFSTNATSAIFKFDPSNNKFTRYDVQGKTVVDDPVIKLAAGQLVFDDKEGALWFTDARTNSIGKLANGQIQLVPIPTEKSGPMGVAVSPDHKQIWFAEILGNKIANLDIATKKIIEYQLPEEDSGPALLVFDDKGVLWVTLSYAKSLLRVEPWLLTSNAISGMTILSLPEPDSFSPFGISIVDGKLYFSDHASSRVIVSDITLQNYTSYWTSQIQTFPTTLPGQVVADQKGNIFFPEHGGNRIAKIDSDTGLMTEYDIPTGPLSTALYASVSKDGSKIWFVEWAANKIAYLDTTVALSFQLSPPLFAGKKVVDQEPIILKQQTTVSLFTSQDEAQELSVTGMTETGLEGITYSTQENGTITLRTQTDAKPGKFTIMIRAANGPVAELYPVNLILDVPVPAAAELPNNQQPFQPALISTQDITRWLASAAAAGLIGYIVYNRIKRRQHRR